jgi:putative transposase
MIPPEFTHDHWPHAPVHKLDTAGVFFLTAATLYKAHHFRDPARLTLLEDKLLRLAKETHWTLEAWAVFGNHYHFVARAEPGASDLGEMLRTLHSETAREINRLDGKVGRKVWHNFLGYPADVSALLFGAIELRAPKSGEAWTRDRGARLPLVLGILVRKDGIARDGQNHLQFQNRQAECARRFLIAKRLECGGQRRFGIPVIIRTFREAFDRSIASEVVQFAQESKSGVFHRTPNQIITAR